MAILPQHWPWEMRASTQLPNEVQRYLADTETTALGGQLHEAVMLEPFLTAGASIFGGLFLLTWVSSANVAAAGLVVNIVIIAVLFALLRLGIKYWMWGHELLFITGKRIIFVHGIITRNVDMMPLGKLTDMAYSRSPWAMLLGYGTFVVESAGQDQALSRLSPIPNPDASYRYIQNLLLGKSVTDARIIDIDTDKYLDVRMKNAAPAGAATTAPMSMGRGMGIEPDEEDWYT